MAGLVAARVLSEHFDEVTLVERDPLPDSFEARKGVPQGRQLHALLARGEQILSDLFPGLVPALLEGGAVRFDFGRDARWFHFGVYKRSFESGVLTTASSRPFLEGHVRRRVLAIPGVRCLDEHDVTGLVTSADRGRVTGVSIRRRGDGAESALEADLTVDASGRGSMLPKWLVAAGYQAPEESVIRVDVKYCGRVYRRVEPSPYPWKLLYVLGQAPESKRLGALFPMEGDRWISILAGVHGDHPPDDPEGYLAFAGSLPAPDMHRALSSLDPLSDIVTYRFPANLRRRYDLLRRVPEGVVALGDALCSFNPIYGQGITTAALAALELGDCLVEQRRRRGGAIEGLARRFFERAASLTRIPWTMTTFEDLRSPEIAADRPPGYAGVERYLSCVHRATDTDTEVYLRFLRAMHMTGSPLALMEPGIIARVMRAELGRLRAGARR